MTAQTSSSSPPLAASYAAPPVSPATSAKAGASTGTRIRWRSISPSPSCVPGRAPRRRPAPRPAGTGLRCCRRPRAARCAQPARRQRRPARGGERRVQRGATVARRRPPVRRTPSTAHATADCSVVGAATSVAVALQATRPTSTCARRSEMKSRAARSPAVIRSGAMGEQHGRARVEGDHDDRAFRGCSPATGAPARRTAQRSGGGGLVRQDHQRGRRERGAASRTRGSSTGTGSGLGLSIVAAIVAAHGGSVTVDSRPGRGPRSSSPSPAAV